MTEQGRYKLTLDEVLAERQWYEDRARGVIQDEWAGWDEAVEQARLLPDVQRLQAALNSLTGPVTRHRSEERQRVHEAIVALINDFGQEDSAHGLAPGTERGHTA